MDDPTSTDSEFWNQFAGSTSANLLVMVVLGIGWSVRKLCERKTKCKSHVHCCCLDLVVRDQTIRDGPGNEDEGDPGRAL